MVRFLIRTGTFFGSAALGLWVASLLVDDMVLTAEGFLVTLTVFVVAQWVLSPLILKLTHRHANAFLGGVGLLSTFVALLVATLVSGGLRITTVTAWVLATIVVWLVTALATLLLPMVLVRDRVAARRA